MSDAALFAIESKVKKLEARNAELVEALQAAIGRFKLIQAEGTTPRERQVIASLGEKEALAASE